MEPKVIESSRLKSIGVLVVSLVFVAAGVGMIQNRSTQPVGAWFCTAFFGLCSLVFALQTLRPSSIYLDSTGFSVTDSFGRSRRTQWSDITPFFLLAMPGSGPLIAYNFEPGRAPASPLLGINRKIGAEGALQGLWSLSQTEMVTLLYAYRTTALGPTPR